MTIGLNLASKEWRRIGKIDSTDEGFEDVQESKSNTARKVEELLKSLPESEGETPLYRDVEAQTLLGDAISHTPEPCASIIRIFYYDGWSMDEIAEEVGLKNAQTAKAKKSQCMTDLIKRVTEALNRAGFDIKPKNRNRNGKN